MDKEQIIGRYNTQIESVDSTNKYVSEALQKQELSEGTIVWALNQTQGKGQKGNSWESESGKNLLLSIVIYPDFIKAASQFMLNKVISLGVAEFIQSYKDDVKIKWPNDIYVGDKKIAGILIENRILGDVIQSSIVGIGININQKEFKSDAPNPVSLYNVTNKEYDLKECLKFLATIIDKWYKYLINEEFELIDTSYLTKLKNYNNFSNYLYEEKVIEAKILGVSEYGKLIIETIYASTIECDLKEITFLFD